MKAFFAKMAHDNLVLKLDKVVLCGGRGLRSLNHQFKFVERTPYVWEGRLLSEKYN